MSLNNFIDEVKIEIAAGSGGDGCLSFRREKFVEFGGPDGGNGGRGGDIFLRSKKGLNTLGYFRFKRHFKAKNGSAGSSKNKTGSSGDSLYLYVPLGTQIFNENMSLIVDLNQDGQEFLIAEGGAGGMGNNTFKSSINQTPRHVTKGESREKLLLVLSLKILSDVGLIGMPNAGKSTLLARCTNAHPKIADYPFTTLYPNLGVVDIGYNGFVMADIPGLIEGASEGIGLGDKFLKHIERCKVLVHLVDSLHDDVVLAYKMIRNELSEYAADLLEKEEFVLLSRCDLINDKEHLSDKINLLSQHTGKKVYTVNISEFKTTELLLHDIYKLLNN